jgi:hypothetical protein
MGHVHQTLRQVLSVGGYIQQGAADDVREWKRLIAPFSSHGYLEETGPARIKLGLVAFDLYLFHSELRDDLAEPLLVGDQRFSTAGFDREAERDKGGNFGQRRVI